MKKNFMFLLAVATIMASCSKESVVDTEVNQASNLISFSTYKTVTRGNPIDDLSEFKTNGNKFEVTAFYSADGASSVAFMGTAAQGTGIVSNGTIWDYAVKPGEVVYWPTQNLDFYALYPYGAATSTTKFSKNKGITFPYTVSTTNADQVDLMFASALNQPKPATPTPVILKFYHALTQVKFKIATATEILKVDLAKDGIILHNISSTADFALPTIGTDNGWTNLGTPATYTVQNTAITGAGCSGATKPAEAPDTWSPWTTVGTADNTLMLIPQQLTPWAPKEGTFAPAGGETGSYLEVKCKIYQMLSDGTTKDYLLGGEGENYGTVYVPFSSKKESTEVWNRSKIVTYNLLIGGGSNPGIFMPITFTTEVDPWVDADGGQIENL